MLRHPARRAHILALIGAGVLIVTFGGIGIELGNDMARHGDMDRQSTAAGSYLRGVHHATSDARICIMPLRPNITRLTGSATSRP